MFSPVISPSFSMLPRKLAYSASMTESGRKAGMTRPFQPESRMALWYSRVSSGVSVVERTSMLNCSKRARGRNSGVWSALRDDVVVLVGVSGLEALGEAELIFEGVVEPEPGGGSAEEVVVPGEYAPDLAGVGAFFAVDLGDAEGLEGDALRVEHAEDVVVGLDEERGGIGEGLVEGEPARVGVAVGREDGQVA